MMPAWILDALSWGHHRRLLEGRRIEAKVSKGKGKSWELRTKLAFLGVLEAMDMAEQRAALGLPQIPYTQAEVAQVALAAQAEGDKIRAIYLHRNLAIIGIAALTVIGGYILTEPKRPKRP
jgi:hypothetical protein